MFSSWAFNKINNKIPQSSRSQTIDVDGTLGTTDELISPHITELNSFEQLLINSINGIKTGSFQAKPDYKVFYYYLFIYLFILIIYYQRRVEVVIITKFVLLRKFTNFRCKKIVLHKIK